ncbi:1-acyl-sn-glycerol-3-phosphate acyltransferase [Nocardioides sp. CFH 31398]|uniref:lysophospholipid acyltransferase family protein n=1 Tax=Nocardioides sp. CFH 31398 TaxID=2919579 RepID=UPI001F06C5DD|nr:lysophospholipid acyltransferase family protein [Nocardioides sp. CFH 31398]MCH1866748.1 1-acyl-sn-glycerol-3-phosphate acyltransferase [Nocardioides sp. CFH 31398]
MSRRVSRIASLARRTLWRVVTALTGGLRTTGGEHLEGPGTTGGRIVVANHSSHGDTAALLAALPAGSRPVFAAAADYWFDVGWRRLVATGLAGILPVRRGCDGAYEAMLDAVRPALERGHTVVVYPEGTRTEDGTVGEFRSGALRLARDCGVPVVPVAVLGTRELLPKNGRLTPGPLEVRVGEPLDPATTDTEALRDAVVGMLDEGPARPRTSRLWRATARLAASRAGLVVAVGWGLAEAWSWPVMAEMALVLLAAAVPAQVPRWALGVVAGSVVGVVTHAWAAAHGVGVPLPWTTDRMVDAAAADLAGGPTGVVAQALSGIPVKVYAHLAGTTGVDLGALAAWTTVGRGFRMAAVALVVWWLARVLHPWLRRLWGPYLVLVCSGFALALGAIVRGWS